MGWKSLDQEGQMSTRKLSRVDDLVGRRDCGQTRDVPRVETRVLEEPFDRELRRRRDHLLRLRTERERVVEKGFDELVDESTRERVAQRTQEGQSRDRQSRSQ